MSKVAVIRIKGEPAIKNPKRRTLELLNLRRKHNCVVIEDTPVTKGMLMKVHDCVTWGKVSQETIDLLSKSKKPVDGKVYRLSPPKGGFERKGIKNPYSIGGALGERDNMDALIKRMI
jgi:large subunit ribosomal protein L30